jgi:hypothetical protein
VNKAANRATTIVLSARLLADLYGSTLTAFDRGQRREQDRQEGAFQGARSMLLVWLRSLCGDVSGEDLTRAIARATDAQKAEHGDRGTGPQPTWDDQHAARLAVAFENLANGARL